MSGCVNIALRDILAGSAAGGYGCQPLKAGGAAQPGGCSACFVPVGPGLGGAVPERGVFWAREWVVSGRDGAAGDCVAMVQESWETCSNGAVLLLKWWCGVALLHGMRDFCRNGVWDVREGDVGFGWCA